MTLRRIIIDTDPGQDDAIAILLALASPELEVLGLTAVAGNVPLARTEANARRIVELAGREDVPVFAGCPRPLYRDSVSATHVHGESGLEGADLPEPTLPLHPRHAVEWLIETLTGAEAPVTLCTLGPLTNIAAALIQAPEVRHGIESVVAMLGAARTHGNITPSAEFNAFADPHAAQVVLRSGCEVTLIPLDVTHQAMTTPERLARFARLPSPIGPPCHGMLSRYYRPNRERFGVEGSPLHDPCVIAYLLEPTLFEGKRVAVDVETESSLTLGATVADWWGVTGRVANALVLQTLDADGFYDLVIDRLDGLARGLLN